VEDLELMSAEADDLFGWLTSLHAALHRCSLSRRLGAGP
jgi:hypothetical protein